MRHFIFLMAFIFLLPQVAGATGGTYVVGCAEGGPIATPMGVAAQATRAARSVSSKVKKVGKSLKSSQKKIIASINKNFETQNALLRQVLTSFGVSEQKMRNTRMFGPQSKAYGAGIVEDRLQSVMKGMSATDALSGRIRHALSQHSREFWKKGQRNFFYASKQAQAVSPSLFFPSNTTLSRSQLRKVKYATRAIIDPFPTPKIKGKHFKNTDASKKYTSERKIKYSYLAQPTAVMSDIMSSYAPTIKLGKWAEKVQKRIGGRGRPPQVVNGKVSLMGYIDLMVDSRFANQSWYSGKQGIHSKTPTGLLRELLVMESVKMKMQNLQMRRMQQMAGLLAQEQAMKTGERLNDSLKKLYGRTVR